MRPLVLLFSSLTIGATGAAGLGIGYLSRGKEGIEEGIDNDWNNGVKTEEDKVKRENCIKNGDAWNPIGGEEDSGYTCYYLPKGILT